MFMDLRMRIAALPIAYFDETNVYATSSIYNFVSVIECYFVACASGN